MSIISKIISQVYAADVVGTIKVPTGVPADTTNTISFVSAIIKLLMVVAGIFTLWQFLSGGFLFISSNGDKGKIAEAQQKIQMSVIGLITMTASFMVIAIISKILFGTFTFILYPILESVN